MFSLRPRTISPVQRHQKIRPKMRRRGMQLEQAMRRFLKTIRALAKFQPLFIQVSEPVSPSRPKPPVPETGQYRDVRDLYHIVTRLAVLTFAFLLVGSCRQAHLTWLRPLFPPRHHYRQFPALFISCRPSLTTTNCLFLFATPNHNRRSATRAESTKIAFLIATKMHFSTDPRQPRAAMY